MRISTLPGLFLAGLLMADVASAADQAQSATQPVAPSAPFTNFASLPKPESNLAVDQYRLLRRYSSKFHHLLTDNATPVNATPVQDEVCYTMRSYKVERKERFSATTEPPQYSTCQPSSRFDLKNATDSIFSPEVPEP
ncbi:MAG TPA: hypothetical protein VK641_02545 [Terriglobales bacterium]|jgi:hypothetical protein|nr:hypothetical protein [Terriglobales bacterium]